MPAVSRFISFETTHEVRDTCLCLHLQRAARVIGRRFDEAFRPLGLTNGQFSLLMALSAPESRSMGTVARLLGMDRTTLTAALKPLAARELVDVRADPADRRGRRLVLTDAGRQALAAAVPIWRETHRAILCQTPGLQADALRATLRSLDSMTSRG
jgi:DNA-binding MarR family transcriptional regulator